MRFMSDDSFLTKEMLRIGWGVAGDEKSIYLCARVSPTRPAPRELRQVLIEATVSGRSGAM